MTETALIIEQSRDAAINIKPARETTLIIEITIKQPPYISLYPRTINHPHIMTTAVIMSSQSHGKNDTQPPCLSPQRRAACYSLTTQIPDTSNSILI